MLKAGKTSTGYRIITLREKGTYKTLSLANLVAESFLEKPEGAKMVGFVDRDKENCSLDNLFWKSGKRSRKSKRDFKSEHERLVESIRKIVLKIQSIQSEAVGICENYEYYASPEEIRRELRNIDFLAFELDRVIMKYRTKTFFCN